LPLLLKGPFCSPCVGCTSSASCNWCCYNVESSSLKRCWAWWNKVIDQHQLLLYFCTFVKDHPHVHFSVRNY
jgi:hypothetical protein